MPITIGLSILLLTWIYLFFSMRKSFASIPVLTPGYCPQTAADLPGISIVVAARNEEYGIERCIRSLLTLDYPDYEIIVVNDGSTDKTPQILEELKKVNARLKIIHNPELKKGWMGKQNALDAGSSTADKKWLLFTDGDIIFHKDSLKKAAQYAIDKKADSFGLIPLFLSGSFWEHVILAVAFFGAVFELAPRKISAGQENAEKSVGAGAFNLIKKDVYRKLGGHEPIKQDVIDDIALANLVRTNGYRAFFASAPQLLRVRMYRNFAELCSGLGKNAYASIGNKPVFLITVSLSMFCLFVVPSLVLLIPALHSPLNIGMCIAAYIIACFTTLYTKKLAQFNGAAVLLHPVAMIIILSILLYSSMNALFKKEIVWRGRRFKLENK